MSSRNLRNVILFGSLIMIGLLMVQGFWLQRAFDIEERQFNHSVQVALKSIADSLIIENPNAVDPEIKQLSSKFFFAEINAEINPKQLDSLIRKELALRTIRADYELGIYNAYDDTLVYGKYIPATIQWQIDHANEGSTAPRAGNSNFAIYFPNKFSVVAGELKIWIFSTIVLLFMVVFFVYAIWTLLREKRLSEMKEDFINNLTHEFKTPLANIELANEALRTKKIRPSHQDHYHKIIQLENARLKNQVDRILEVATLQKKDIELDRQKVDVHMVINDLVAKFDLRMQKRSGIFKLNLEAEDTNLLVDEFHFTNSVYNLLDNAEKYSRDQPSITISTKNKSNGLLLSIRDTGSGIKKEFQKHVFDRFFRVPTGNIHNVKGFGLGLSYVRSIVEAHQGKVWLQSEVDRGSQFDIFIPQS